MPFRYFSPGATLFGLVVAGIFSLFSGGRRRRRRTVATSQIPQPDPVRQANFSAMQRVVAMHTDCTAEVIDIIVTGHRHVSTFRLLSPGREVELRAYNDDIKVFAYGQYVCELIPRVGSNVPRLFAEKIPFEAYLGGRDMAFLDNDSLDLCSIIIFYKLDGVPPTKVDLH